MATLKIIINDPLTGAHFDTLFLRRFQLPGHPNNSKGCLEPTIISKLHDRHSTVYHARLGPEERDVCLKIIFFEDMKDKAVGENLISEAIVYQQYFSRIQGTAVPRFEGVFTGRGQKENNMCVCLVIEKFQVGKFVSEQFIYLPREDK